ncbi:hypothetical protein CEW89_05840 [Celeribacter ethanolicus]|uniref:Uncharacterized protein n=1 Tax=Celeribacter ethanolicus TaxID=1758178 RepID=A0A291GAU9_9RHOB|nr:hypothetical protein [Celeribacter ethanolicus]ATG47136.1 hypothetical protein CEW89_05840 [Celeribacter ethanolicus]
MRSIPLLAVNATDVFDEIIHHTVELAPFASSVFFGTLRPKRKKRPEGAYCFVLYGNFVFDLGCGSRI